MPKTTAPTTRSAALELAEKQIKDGKPAETRKTFQRLTAAGYSETDARRMIAAVIMAEVLNIPKANQPYNEARYLAALRRLPKLAK